MKFVILNPPSSSNYINRDLMGGMGTKVCFGGDVKTRIVNKIKSKGVQLPVMPLVYTATILSNAGHKLLIIDAMNQGLHLNEVIKKIKQFMPDFVVMAVSSSNLLFERDTVASLIKKEVPKCKIITVGDTLSLNTKLINENIDFVIAGEPEKVIIDIAEGTRTKDIKGIIYKKKGAIIKNKKREFLKGEELDKLPSPKWELFPYKKYSYFPLVRKTPFVPILGSRGCPFGCYYCPYSKNMGLSWRARRVENIVNEIELDKNKYGIKAIQFRDPLFAINKKRVIDFCNELINRKIKIEWGCEIRPEILDEECLSLMRKSGCRGLNLGIESIYKDELESVGRREIPLQKIKDVVSFAEKIGIRTACFFVFGFPHNTIERIKKMVDFSFELNPSYVEYKVLTPYYGTKLYEIAEKNSWLVDDSDEAFGGYRSGIKVSEELDPKVLDKICDDSFRRFYLRSKILNRELKRGTLFYIIKVFSK